MSSPVDRRTRVLLLAGVLAGLLITVVSLVLAAAKPGFDIRRHPNSLLVLGDWGWVQTWDMLLYGVLLMVFAVGVWQASRPYLAGRVAAVGVGLYGLLGSVVVGLNPAPPMFGYPPGAPAGSVPLAELGTAAKVHGVAGSIGFTAMALSCFAFAWYFIRTAERGWALLSAVIGLAVIGVTGYLAKYAGAEVDSFNYMPTWIVGTALWLYVAAVAARLYERTIKQSV